VLSIAQRYTAGAKGRPYRKIDSTAEVGEYNQVELDAVMAPAPVLIDQIRTAAAELATACDALTAETVIPFHTFTSVSGTAWQTYWLGELLMHGEDIALAAGLPWKIGERDMLIVVRGLMEIGPAYVRADLSPTTDVCVAFTLTGARPYLIHIHDGIAEFRARRPEDRPDAVLRGPASAMAQMFYARIGVFSAARRGLLVVGGRRPWKALKLMTYFESP
jgi:hypothetical protein